MEFLERYLNAMMAPALLKNLIKNVHFLEFFKLISKFKQYPKSLDASELKNSIMT